MTGLPHNILFVIFLLNIHTNDGYGVGTKGVLFSNGVLTSRTRQRRQAEASSDGDADDSPGRPTNPSLRKVVPNGYDKYILPKGRDGGPLPIYISAKVRDIQKIDEQNMELTIEWFIRLFWRDSGLLWPKHLPNGTWLNISPDIVDYVWLPTTFIDHVKEVTKPSLVIQPESFRMLNDGLIRYSMSLTTRVSCPMDFSAYPFDTQVCYFKMESYQFTSAEVTYEWYNPVIERSKKIQLGQFDFDFYSVTQQNTSHQGRKFPSVLVEVLLKRRISYHLMNTFLPSGLFVMVSWLTFLVPVHMVPGRMVLTITTLLTMVSMFAAVRQESPKVSYAKAVDQWMIMCIILMFLVLFEFTFAIYLYSKAEKAKESEKKMKEEKEKANKISGVKIAPAPDGPMATQMYTSLGQRTSQERPESSQSRRKSGGSQATGNAKFKEVWKVHPRGESFNEKSRDYKFWSRWQYRVETYSPVVFFIVFVICNISYWSYWMQKWGTVQKDY